MVLALLLLRTFGFSDAEFGLVFGIGGLGAVVSAIISLRLIKRLGVGISIIFGILISGFPFLSFYFVGASGAFLAASLAFFLSSFGGVLVQCGPGELQAGTGPP